MPTSTRRKHPFYDGFPAKTCRFPIFHRRGGRPCPPAGIVRFYGKPMRICNILAGRCGHRPLRTTTENQRISRADRVVRPYKGYWIERVGRAKNRRVSHFAPWRADVGIGPYERPRKINEFRGRTESSAPTNGHDESQRVSFLTPPPQTRLRGFFCPCGAALGKMAHESVQRFEFGRCIYI